MILKIFTQPKCPKCPNAKVLGKKVEKEINDLKVEYFNVTTLDGLAEASFYTVFSTPGVILCDSKDKEIVGWRGETPKIDELKKHLF